MTLPACPVCHGPCLVLERHQCPGMSSQPVFEVARAIVRGDAFVDGDAVRVAREYLAVTGTRAAT